MLSIGDKERARKTAVRKVLIELGLYSIPNHKIFKNKKKYDRKNYRIENE